MQSKLFIFILCLINTSVFSQIKGDIVNNKEEPLPFVNIYIEDTFKGTTSNDDGIYELDITEKGTYTIIFKYLGYKTLKKEITIEEFPYTLNAILIEEDISLSEVVINSSENPANQIIREAIAHRKSNLEKIKQFKADFYSRGFIKIENVPEKILGQEVGDLEGNLDSTRSGMIYLSETISKIEYEFPDQLKEHIIASKISGNDSGFSFNSASSVDFNLYANTVELGNQIVSPISDYAFNYYRFKLEGIFYDDQGHLINKIEVIPKRKKDRIFTGYVYIVEDEWTFYALELSITGEQAQIPATKIITIKQNFASTTNDIWALISNSIYFEYGFLGITGNGRFTAVYSNYDFEPEFTKETFSNEVLSVENEANKKDTIFWNKQRKVPLTLEESNDYVKKDSIQIIRKSKTFRDSVDAKNNCYKIANTVFGYTYINSYENWDLGYTSLLEKTSFNTVQGFNTGIGINYSQNVDEFNRFFTISGAFNYGFSDKRLRAEASFFYKFNNIKRPILKLSGGVKTQQFNRDEPISRSENSGFSLFGQKNYMKIYDKTFMQIGYAQEIFNGLHFNSDLAYERRKPLFNTTDQTWNPKANRSYTSNNPLDETAFNVAPFLTHSIFKLNLNAEINFGQKYLSYPDGKYNIRNRKYPTLNLYSETGFGASESDYNFNHFAARIHQNFNIGNKGLFQYNLKAGTFSNADNIAFTDYKHFNGNQLNFGTANSYLNVFNNLPYYEFSTNKSYVEFHAEHDFKGFILGKIPLINKLNFNLVVGVHNLSTQDRKPYQEFSVGLNNVGWGDSRFYRIDYVRSYQSGFLSDAIIIGIKLLN